MGHLELQVRVYNDPAIYLLPFGAKDHGRCEFSSRRNHSNRLRARVEIRTGQNSKIGSHQALGNLTGYILTIKSYPYLTTTSQDSRQEFDNFPTHCIPESTTFVFSERTSELNFVEFAAYGSLTEVLPISIQTLTRFSAPFRNY